MQLWFSLNFQSFEGEVLYSHPQGNIANPSALLHTNYDFSQFNMSQEILAVLQLAMKLRTTQTKKFSQNHQQVYGVIISLRTNSNKYFWQNHQQIIG